MRRRLVLERDRETVLLTITNFTDDETVGPRVSFLVSPLGKTGGDLLIVMVYLDQTIFAGSKLLVKIVLYSIGYD